MKFAHPGDGYLLFGLALLGGFLYWLSRYRRHTLRAMERVGFVLPQLATQPTRFRTGLAPALLSICWTSAVLALMHPVGNPRPLDADEGKILSEQVSDETGEVERTVRRKAHDVIFLLDASASMAVSDTRLGQRRLDAAKELIDEVASHLSGQNAALYAFTSEVTSLVPPTVDYLYLRLMLRRVGINEGDAAGTDLADALDSVLRRHGKSRRALSLVLLTDGGDTRLEAAEGGDRDQQLKAITSRVKGRDLQVFTVGLGSHEGHVIPDVTFEGQPVISTLDEELLEQLGTYYFANDYSALGLAQELVQRIEDEDSFQDEEETIATVDVERLTGSDEEPELVYKHYFQIPLALAALALGIEIGTPYRRRRA